VKLGSSATAIIVIFTVPALRTVYGAVVSATMVGRGLVNRVWMSMSVPLGMAAVISTMLLASTRKVRLVVSAITAFKVTAFRAHHRNRRHKYK
jgi:hypothetical protein